MADTSASKVCAARRCCRLPTPILRALSGGGVVYPGRPHARSAPAVPGHARPAAAPSPSAMHAGGGPRAGVGRIAGPGGRRPGAGRARRGADHRPAPRGAIPARAYRPEAQDPAAPLMVFAHFGGGVIGDLETCHVFCTILAKVARCAGAVRRLPPGARAPLPGRPGRHAGRLPLGAATTPPRFGAPAGQAAIGGDSMGGNFAAVICQELKRAGEPQPVLQLLIYPGVDVASESAVDDHLCRRLPAHRAT